MYARLSSVLFPVAAILLIGAAIWGYQEHQEKNSILIKAENQYQRAFHDLNHHMNRLHDELGQTLAVSSASHDMQRKGLVNVWRLTSQAQNEVNQLPLALLPFDKAEQFLARINNFAYSVSVRDLTKKPLTSHEVKTLKTLYANSKDINQDLGRVQDAVISNRLRWMDVETAMASEKNPHDNTIIDGFRTVDKKIGTYPETDFGPAALAASRRLSTSSLTGRDLSTAEIRDRAVNFLGRRGLGSQNLKVSESGARTDFRTFSVTSDGKDGNRIQMAFTRKGGQLLWYMNPREVKSRRLSFGAAQSSASGFLNQRGYRDMTPVTYDEYDHVAVFAFVRTQGGVRYYPDKVTVRVALDSGEIVGLQATDHVFAAQRLTTQGKPKISREKAAKGLNPELKVQSYSLAVIDNDTRQPVLCHEFTGKINGAIYRIYMNGETGVEEKVERIPDTAKPIYRT
ncbi:germination protein YpeB [Cohnella pontilimi]|uniref:Germination protein YpeB n=1 Tax=Cohnella pontilimi TaxID=2564100 RepID=A0A4V5LSV0_9BACL|nr:germination protein YpeB [Cohnella pontilimi]TJY44369.1 germination protein YpeB [Cohnella pontilimi]